MINRYQSFQNYTMNSFRMTHSLLASTTNCRNRFLGGGFGIFGKNLCMHFRRSAIFGPFPPSQKRGFGSGFGGGKRYHEFNRKRVFHAWRDAAFRNVVGACVLVGGMVYWMNLEVVPVSGRRRFNVVGPGIEARMAKEMYEETLRQFRGKILHGRHAASRNVQRVLDRLIPASGLQHLDWEVFVIDDDSVKNAFVIPGGKVFVFSGILPFCGDDDGLATVLSHEIAHTLAHHSAERMSKSLLAVAALLVAAVSIGDVGYVGRIIMDLVFLRPGSRRQEAEADYIGLMIMAQACYNPDRAVNLWERMEKAQQSASSPPQFLSTHPSNTTRIQNILQWLPEARAKRNMSGCEGGMIDYANEFRSKLHVNW